MRDVDVLAALDHRRQQVVGGVEVVVHGVALVGAGFHRVGRGALLGEVDDGVGSPVVEQVQQALVVDGDVEVVERDVAAGDLFPSAQALAHGADGGEGFAFQFDVDLAPREVVHDGHFVAQVGQMQRRGPATEAVAAENQDFHGGSPKGWKVKRGWFGPGRLVGGAACAHAGGSARCRLRRV